MKTKLWLILLFVVLGMVFALPAPVQATKPVDDLVIDADLTIDPLTGNSADGSFTISSPALGISDCGSASQTFYIDWIEYTIHGVKTLEGSQGTIILKFRGQITPSGVIGSFTIISGTGDYAKLHGVGSTFAAIMGLGITAHYEGSAHFD